MVESLGFWAVAGADPDRVAIIGPDGLQTTFGELQRASRSMALALRELGSDCGDGIAVVLPNRVAFVVAYLAAMESGLYFTPVNSHLVAPEVAHVIGDCEAKAVVVDGDLAEMCRPGVDAGGVDAACRFADPEAEGYRPLSELLTAGERLSGAELPVGLGVGTTMLYTSGTTGKPKGVRRPLVDGDPNAILGAAAVVYCKGFGMTPGAGTHLVCGPLYHAAPLASATNALHVGTTLVLIDRWTPEACLELIERHRVTNTQMVPTMFHRLLSLPDEVRSRYDVSSVESVMHTGAPCPPHVKQRFMDWFGPVVYETYGGTESVATIASPRRWLQKPGTVGKAIHGVTLHILDENGDECPVGSTGSIYIESDTGRGRPEYFKDPEKTAAMLRGDWVTLGDVGFVDEDGFLFLRDRTIDMIISGGVNIYPAEIESVLLESRLVLDAAVIGVPDAEWGESVLAIVEPVEGVEASAETVDALLDLCATRLARFKLPRRIELVDELPRLPNGKIQKRLLREPYWRDADRSI